MMQKDIEINVYRAEERSYDINFVWILSHADGLARSAYDKQREDVAVPLAAISHITRTSFKEDLS